ncbi:uncharacterized protein SPPG_03880 [Spizellomyces punctatus DAOM BR117]|uniref:Uncharacterized protein n=1 Tax=Spizellomyces punctatus (strain DAOM BR117) TaxID=645134 RepID=A0A0L0HI36_SPIPD|nr:uncharacterized protein SPPG_03880 [Spizellomyces punctatus DAOM BR117]KND00767.1 hypothetical protein SPPG_03880 [Spizellomyces punctatus DAOM BR117]|eukprot:XP_016608806.1 hypothetical protein SPPG_03880 [Spizellomyces punctatus DAOM BR117]
MYAKKRRTFEEVPNNAESKAYWVGLGLNPDFSCKFTSPRKGWSKCEAFDPDTGDKCGVDMRKQSTDSLRFDLCARHTMEGAHQLLLVREWLSTFPFREGSDEKEKRILSGNIYKKMDASGRWHIGLRDDLPEHSFKIGFSLASNEPLDEGFSRSEEECGACFGPTLPTHRAYLLARCLTAFSGFFWPATGPK